MDTNEIKLYRKHFSQIGLIMFLGTLIVYGVQLLALFIAGKIPAISENYSLSFVFVMLPMYIIAFPIIFAMLKKVPVQLTGEKKRMKVSHFFIGFLISYAFMYVANLCGTILTTILSLITKNPASNTVLEVTGEINPVANFLIIVVIAPIMEELLFRKFLIDRISAYGEGIAVFLSALMFGLFHGNLGQFIYAFVLGIFFGFFYIKTKNLLYPILLHMMINFLGGFVSSLLLKASGYMELLQNISADGINLEWISEHLLGLSLFLLYSGALLVCVLLGIIIFAINQHKFVFNQGEIIVYQLLI